MCRNGMHVQLYLRWRSQKKVARMEKRITRYSYQVSSEWREWIIFERNEAVVPALCLEHGYFNWNKPLLLNKVENRRWNRAVFHVAYNWLYLQRRSTATIGKSRQHIALCERRAGSVNVMGMWNTSSGGGREPCFALIFLQSSKQGYAYIKIWFAMQPDHFNRKATTAHKSGGLFLGLALHKNNRAASSLLTGHESWDMRLKIVKSHVSSDCQATFERYCTCAVTLTINYTNGCHHQAHALLLPTRHNDVKWAARLEKASQSRWGYLWDSWSGLEAHSTSMEGTRRELHQVKGPIRRAQSQSWQPRRIQANTPSHFRNWVQPDLLPAEDQTGPTYPVTWKGRAAAYRH